MALDRANGSDRAGWYNWDAIDNGGRPSATNIIPAFQTLVRGDIMPAVPGANDAFIVAAVDPPRDLVLTVPDGYGGHAVAWEHHLEATDSGHTRLIVRGRASSHWLDRARAKPRSRARRIVCGLLLTYGSLGLLWPFTAMHQRDVLAVGGGTLSDTMHVALGGVTVLLMFLAIAVGATAFGKRFRLYSVSSIVILLAFGALTFWEAPRLQTNLPTPWIGLWERINISVFLLWVVVLATALLRTGTGRLRPPGETRWTT